MAALSTCFAFLALMLACLGLYGVIAFAVSRRTQEIGLRIALGAQPSKVLADVMRSALLLTTLGIIGGIPLCLWASKGARSMLFGVEGITGAGVAVAAAALLIASAAASWAPARLASRVDPAIALRQT
jgi:ABC-type antimicrobial peptide transport system permease subunit